MGQFIPPICLVTQISAPPYDYAGSSRAMLLNRETGKLAPTRDYLLDPHAPIAREFDYPHDVPVRQPSYAIPNDPHDW